MNTIEMPPAGQIAAMSRLKGGALSLWFYFVIHPEITEPSADAIASSLGWHKRTVVVAINRLRRAGFLDGWTPVIKETE